MLISPTVSLALRYPDFAGPALYRYFRAAVEAREAPLPQVRLDTLTERELFTLRLKSDKVSRFRLELQNAAVTLERKIGVTHPIRLAFALTSKACTALEPREGVTRVFGVRPQEGPAPASAHHLYDFPQAGEAPRLTRIGGLSILQIDPNTAPLRTFECPLVDLMILGGANLIAEERFSSLRESFHASAVLYALPHSVPATHIDRAAYDPLSDHLTLLGKRYPLNRRERICTYLYRRAWTRIQERLHALWRERGRRELSLYKNLGDCLEAALPYALEVIVASEKNPHLETHRLRALIAETADALEQTSSLRPEDLRQAFFVLLESWPAIFAILEHQGAQPVLIL